MDIQKERVLATFIEWAKCEKMCTDGETTLLNYNFYDPKTRTAWKSWQAAQTIPEGFVLVPKEIPDHVVQRLENSSYHWGDSTRDYFAPIYEMMIEAAEGE